MIKYEPSELLRKIAPKRKIEKLVTRKLTLNRAVLSLFDGIDFISKDKIKDSALATIKQYKERFKDEIADGATATEATDEALAGKKLLVNRVQNGIVHQIAKQIKSEYRGEYYTWLPSTAAEPDPLHQLNYGKKFRIGRGEMPGDRWGCQCGMHILVEESELDL